MIEVINNNEYGCIIWGTKSGYKILDKYNVNVSSDTNQDEYSILEKELADVRYVVDCNKQGALFYDLRLHKDTRCYTIYQIIYDGKDRPGFYAITICTKNRGIISGEELQSLFKKVIANFRTEYITRDKYGYEIIKPEATINSAAVLKGTIKSSSSNKN